LVSLLERKDRAEKSAFELEQERGKLMSKRELAASLANLVDALQSGRLSGKVGGDCDEGLHVAIDKQQELAATSPRTLCKSGGTKIQGIRHALDISGRSLADTASALRDVQATSTSAAETCILAEALEMNLRMRKEINAYMRECLDRTEFAGQQASHSNGSEFEKYFMESKACRDPLWGSVGGNSPTAAAM